jgi:hypothetical protein
VLTWQQCKYGTAVLAGMAITGATIFLVATTRRQVEPQDVVELFEAVAERRLALMSAWPAGAGVTQWVPTWAADPSSHRYPVHVASNVWGTTNYLVLAGSNAVPPDPHWVLALSYTGVYSETVGRIVWGPWPRIEAAGFPSVSGRDYNGTYAYATSWVASGNRLDLYVMTNNAERLLWDYGLGDAHPWRLQYAAVAGLTNLPAQYYPPSTLATPLWTDAGEAAAWRGGWLADPWELRVTGAGVTGACAAAGAALTNRLREGVASQTLRRAPAVARRIERGTLAALDAVIMGLATQYVDDVALTNAALGTAIPMHTLTGLWTRLGIGQISNGTCRFTRQPALGTNAATYGALPWVMYREDLQERGKVLAALRATARNVSGWANGWGASTTIVDAVLNVQDHGLASCIETAAYECCDLWCPPAAGPPGWMGPGGWDDEYWTSTNLIAALGPIPAGPPAWSASWAYSWLSVCEADWQSPEYVHLPFECYRLVTSNACWYETRTADTNGYSDARAMLYRAAGAVVTNLPNLPVVCQFYGRTNGGLLELLAEGAWAGPDLADAWSNLSFAAWATSALIWPRAIPAVEAQSLTNMSTALLWAGDALPFCAGPYTCYGTMAKRWYVWPKGGGTNAAAAGPTNIMAPAVLRWEFTRCTN